MKFWCSMNLDLDVLSDGCDTDGSTGTTISCEEVGIMFICCDTYHRVRGRVLPPLF